MNIRIRVLETNTLPSVIHGNGNSKSKNSVYDTMLTDQLSKKIIPDNFDDYTFISWKGGNNASATTILELSGRQYGFNVLNLKWAPGTGFWKDSQQKITRTLEAINNGTINTEYVFWLDNSDVFFIDSPRIVAERCITEYSGYDFVWNAERNNYPTPLHGKWNGSTVSKKVENLLNDVIEYDNTFSVSSRYMNSGASFGKTTALYDMLVYANSLIGDSRLNDQALMRIAQHQMRDRIAVDRNSSIFMCCWGIDNDSTSVAWSV